MDGQTPLPFDLTDGGRRRIVSEDQAANLLERAEQRAEFERYWAELICTNQWGDAPARIRRDQEQWDQLGEGSQDPGDWEPA